LAGSKAGPVIGPAQLPGGATMKKFAFKAKLEDAGSGGHGYVFFPYDTKAEFGTRGMVPVRATFDGVAFRGSLVKYGNPRHMLPVLKDVRAKIGKGVGDTIDVVVWKDDEVRTVEVPAEFAKLMKKEGVLAAFEKLSYTHRKEYCRWIGEAKKEETRSARIAKSVEMLKKGIKTPG
jgi:hypothetical protein